MTLSPETDTHYVDNFLEVCKFMEWIDRDHEAVAFDLETTGLDPRDPNAGIRLAQLGGLTDGWAIPWDGWSGIYMEALNRLVSRGVRLVGHNTSFDNRWLQMFAGWDVPYELIEDTMIASQVVEPDLPSGLKDLADRYVDRRASAGQKMLKDAMKEQGWTWETVPTNFHIYWTYGCLDTIITLHLWYHYREGIETYRTAYDLEMNARRVVSAMEDNGIRIDMDYCKEKYDELKQYVADSKKWAVDNWNVNIGSAPQVVDLFQNRLGQSIAKLTASGAPSVDKEQMAVFEASDDPVVAATASFILGVKNADKKANSYFKNFLDFQNDGILHTSFKTLGARTGRMSSTRPALQTISKQDTVLRDAFLPHEGHVLLSCDYSQVELRLMCHFSEDPNLIQAFQTADATGGDFFVEMSKAIFKDDNFKKSDPRRGLVKTFCYAYLYGAGITKMAKSAGVPVEEMRQFVKDLSDAYPGIPEFQNKILSLGEARERSDGQGYVFTPTGRRIPCDKGQARTLVNYLLQGTASEIMKQSLIRMDAADLTPYMLLAIHDEVIVSCPRDEYDDISRSVSDIMSVRGEYAVDLIAEAEGPFTRWGDKLRVS